MSNSKDIKLLGEGKDKRIVGELGQEHTFHAWRSLLYISLSFFLFVSNKSSRNG